MGFIGVLMLLIMVETQHDFPLVEIQFNGTTLVKQKDDASWAIPAYEQTKHIIKCVEKDNIKCLRSN